MVSPGGSPVEGLPSPQDVVPEMWTHRCPMEGSSGDVSSGGGSLWCSPWLFLCGVPEGPQEWDPCMVFHGGLLDWVLLRGYIGGYPLHVVPWEVPWRWSPGRIPMDGVA
jgi:hypothetical protein